MLYKFKLGYDTAEATKNINYTKGEGAVDYMVGWLVLFYGVSTPFR